MGNKEENKEPQQVYADLQEGGKKIVSKVNNAIERAGKQVAKGAADLIPQQKTEEITEEAIKAAVDQALDIIEVAGDRVRERSMNAERVTIEAGVGIFNVVQLRIRTDIPEIGDPKSDETKAASL
ncbi:MAG: hypothetical protein WBA76_07330 [Phormidesmis sp.]